jgi:hypothetical protein
MSDRIKVPGSAGDKGKAERLAKALRANLKRRKSQARAQETPAAGAALDDDEPENAQNPGEK